MFPLDLHMADQMRTIKKIKFYDQLDLVSLAGGKGELISWVLTGTVTEVGQ